MNMHQHLVHKPYFRLLIMAIISFKLMYLFMYAMVNVWGNVFPNWNQFYMAGLMVAPMVILEIILMKAMYENKTWNVLIMAVSVASLVLFWMGIRVQAGISDEQFLKSMIPHHGSAILMCQEARLEDLELQALCRNIMTGQQAEIDFMKAKLNSLQK